MNPPLASKKSGIPKSSILLFSLFFGGGGGGEGDGADVHRLIVTLAYFNENHENVKFCSFFRVNTKSVGGEILLKFREENFRTTRLTN